MATRLLRRMPRLRTVLSDEGRQPMFNKGITAMTGETKRSSRKRWFVLFLISLMYFISYLDRVNMSTAAPVISKEFGFDKITMGFIFSAFVWSYAIFQIPGGWLGDRFGPRRVLTALLAYWSVMVAFVGAATGVTSFAFSSNSVPGRRPSSSPRPCSSSARRCGRSGSIRRNR